MRILAIIMLALAIAVAIAGCAVRHEDPSVNATLKKTEDSITVTSMADATIVSVTSKSGIGGATLIRVGESWPPFIAVRLKLNNLESFEMKNGYIRFTTSVGSPESVPYWRVGKSEKRPGQPEGSLAVSVKRTGEWFEIDVPREMVDANATEIGFEWINEFRR
jgi:hypothetical protein